MISTLLRYRSSSRSAKPLSVIGRRQAMGTAGDNFEFSKNFRMNNGYLYCEQVRIKTLQDSLKSRLDKPSPFYVYSKQQLVDNIDAYKSSLEQLGVKHLLGYAVKANYNPWILKILLDRGCTAVTVNGHETQLALDTGMPARDVIFNGNGKESWELELAVGNECLVSVDSEFDLRHIADVGRNVGRRARIMLRLNPDIDPIVHPFLATGVGASKFGLEEKCLDDVLTFIAQDTHLLLVGIHCHIGSTIDNLHAFSKCLDVMLDKLQFVESKGFQHLQYLSMGGGLGIDYKKHAWRTKEVQEEEHDQDIIPSPADLINKMKERLKERPGLCLILEPGRSLVGSAALLITKVIGCKENRGKKYIVVDGSMTEVIRPSLYGAYHHIELTEPVSTSCQRREKFEIVGPVCECADFLGKDRWLVRPHEGCGVALFDAGAYCASMGSNYNLRMRPAEILVDGDKWTLIRKPDSINHLLTMYKF